MESPEVTKADLPPLFSWVRVRRTPTSGPILGFFYVDRTAGPSVKGRFVRDESDRVQIERLLESPNATFRMPGFDFEVLGNDQARALGLPVFPEWYLKFFDDGTAAVFSERATAAGSSLGSGQYLNVTAVSGSLHVRVCGHSLGSRAPQARSASAWKRFARKAAEAVKKPDQPQSDPMTLHPLDGDALTATAERGRLIAQLDRVAAAATDAVNALQPDTSLLGYYIAYQGDRRWRVAFGKLSTDESVFRTAFEAVSTSRFGWPFDVHIFRPPRNDCGWLWTAAKAIATSLRQPLFSSAVEAYNYVVVPEPDNGISVYWYPGSTCGNVEVIGADFRVTVARDDSVTVERYHNFLLRSEPGRTILAHAHLLVHDPVPLDVAYVLMRRPPRPMVVVSKNWTFFITRGGAIVPVDLGDTIEIGDSLATAIEEVIGDNKP